MGNKKRGVIHLYKLDFEDGKYALNIGCDGSANLDTKAFRIMLNQCVGHPNMTLFDEKSIRDERYEKARRMLLDAGYTIEEK
ncbi:hypothetical protein [Bacillus amyloliquefaciens]|uniref:hypothetical protein n=1 Tax=Bacillus amyloliquefaciens TaxID=1390 RepID=UPI0030EC6ACD